MSDLQLTIIGCDGSWPAPGGACSSYLLRSSTTSILIDIGNGSLANLQMHIRPRALDAIIVTHEHPDHCADLFPLSVMFKQSTKPHVGLPVYATPGVQEQIFSRLPFGAEFEWTELENEDELAIGDLLIRFSQTDHPVVTFGVRVDCGDRTFVFTADTGTEWKLTALGGDIDLALCEAAMPEGSSSPGHLNSQQGAHLANNAGTTKLMLTHIRPDFDREQMRKEAEQVFNGDVLIAVKDQTYLV